MPPWGRLLAAAVAPSIILAILRGLSRPAGRHAKGPRRSSPISGSVRRFIVTDVVLTAAAVALAVAIPVSRPLEPLCPAQEDAVETALGKMTLEVKAGQVLIVGFTGQDVSPETASLILENHVGGLILFASNVSGKAQVARLTADLQATARQGGSPGLLISAMDQEGGVVARLTERDGVTVFPGNMALGAAAAGAAAAGAAGKAKGEDLTHRAASVTGSELKALGLNLNLAPVLDVNNNPANPVIGVRSFGEDPDLVSRLGLAALKGYHEAGVAAAAKHFPGHGDTATDSHFDLPTVPWGIDRLNQIELPPFRKAVAAGVDAVLVAHVTFPAIEPRPGVPASLSGAVLGGLLRHDLGFEGVIITDAIEMKAVSDRYTTPQIVQMALGGGADVILVGQDPPRAKAAYQAILAAVNEGKLSQQDLDASVRRVLRLKARLGLLPEAAGVGTTGAGGAALGAGAGGTTDLAAVGSPANRQVALDVARASLTLVRDQGNLLPLKPGADGQLVLIAPDLLRLRPGDPVPTGGASGAVTSLGAYLRSRQPNLTEFVYPAVPGRAAADQAAVAAGAGTLVILATASARIPPGQVALVKAVLGAGRPVVWVSLWSPYDLAAVPSAPTYVATYSFRDVSLQALAEALFGEVAFGGRLPVTIPLAAPGAGAANGSISPKGC